MSKMEITTTITRKYLRGKTKDEIIEHVMRLLDENDKLAAEVALMTYKGVARVEESGRGR